MVEEIAVERRELLERVRRDLATRSRPGLPVYLIAWVVLGAAVSFSWPRPALTNAVGLGLAVATVARWLLIRDALGDGGPVLGRWLSLFRASTALTAFLLGSFAGLLTFDLGLHDVAVAALAVTAAVGSAAIYVFAPDAPLIVSFLLALNGPLATALLLRGGRAELTVVLAEVLFVGYCVALGRRLNREYRDAFHADRLLRAHAEDLERTRENLRLAKEAAERSDRAKSEFLATMSHELRTPLTAINGALGLMGGGATGELTAEAKELVRLATRNSERLVGLINEVLDFQKLEAGRLAFDKRAQALAPLVVEAAAGLRPWSRQRGVEIVTRVDDEDVRVDVDGGKLVQVVTNLVGNAVKFSPSGVDVTVAVARHRPDAVRVSVSDRGPGVPEWFRGRIFEKFAQADAGDERRAGGTGLGLSISKALVEGMGGTIGFETETGRGTTFFVELPTA